MDSTNNDRIDSWKEISAYLGRDVSTVIRWEKEKGLPAHRIPGGTRQGVFAYRHELDMWLAGPGHAGELAISPVAEVEIHSLPNSPGATLPSKTPYLRRAMYTAVGFLAAVFLIAAFSHMNTLFRIPNPRLAGQRQLTTNGREKKGLLTAGKNVYFGQEQNGWFALAAMPVDGGPVRVLWNPQASVLPVDVSPDDKELLALCGKSVEVERELWIVPLATGEPHRLANLTAHSAAWGPDSRTIAYASGTAIYLTSVDRLDSTKIGVFASVPRALHWSRDGSSLRFILDGLASGQGVLWGQISNDSMRTITMRPLPSSRDWFGNWAPAGRIDAHYVWNSSESPREAQAWLVQYGSRWWEPSIHVAPLSFVQGQLYGMASVPESSSILVLTKPKQRASFVRYDPKVHGSRRILPGASGTYLNYSRDGEWVTYVGFREGSLWISRADGTDAQQLTFPPENVELPQWSPDGKQIAYMTSREGHVWRIHIMDVKNGATREASKGNDGQGAPTWSPDGRFISYGGVNCEESHSCAIHRINLADGKVQTLPDSDGLFSARWSPDGRHIAALHLEKHQLMLFDVQTEKWSMLADAVNGTDLGWSPTSKYLYIDVPGDARIVQIRVADAHQETVMSLRAQDDFNLAEVEDLQFSIGPDEAVITHRQISSTEIFAYDLQDH